MRIRDYMLALSTLIGAVAVAALVPVAPTNAHSPAPKAKIEIHDHNTPGRGWYIEAEVSPTGGALKSVVLYVEQCKQTVHAEDIPLSPDGAFSMERTLAASGGKGEGTWRLSGRFVDPKHVEGTYDMVSEGCVTGERRFQSPRASKHSHYRSGTPPGEYPDLSKASGRRRAEARRLWKKTLVSARRAPFRTFRSARRAGYKLAANDWPKPLLFHLRNKGHDLDRHLLDPRRPESLVYWWPENGRPVLIGYMYRGLASKAPAFGRPLLGWHAHRRSEVGTQMTHVWLTGGLRTALANCLPVRALETAVHGFRFAKTRAGGSGPETRPCPPMRTRATRATLSAKRRCFGAAARDPEHQPCKNRKLRVSVVPPPRKARLTPGAPCKSSRKPNAPEICAFGVRASKAAATVALVGDSHAVHWRAALQVVARAKRWRALTLYHSRCPFTEAINILPEPGRSQCARWKLQVKRWFADHPEVNTVFVSQHSGGGVVVGPGQTGSEAKVAGYLNAWKALPASVKHIIVIRDVPYSEPSTHPCVERAMANRKPAARSCALPRRTALRPDPAVEAAAQLLSPRVQAVDLTNFMCGKLRCFPVVGGVLVHKDGGHISRLFSTTLGPFLLREVRRLMAGWG